MLTRITLTLTALAIAAQLTLSGCAILTAHEPLTDSEVGCVLDCLMPADWCDPIDECPQGQE